MSLDFPQGALTKGVGNVEAEMQLNKTGDLLLTSEGSGIVMRLVAEA